MQALAGAARGAGLAGVEAVDAGVLRAVAALAAALVPHVEGAEALAGWQALVVPLVCERRGAGRQQQQGAGCPRRLLASACVEAGRQGGQAAIGLARKCSRRRASRFLWQLVPLGQDWPG